MLLVHIGSMIVVSLHETDWYISSLRENSNQSHQSLDIRCLNFLLHFPLPSVSFIHRFFLPGSILPTIPPLTTPPVIRLPLTPITLSCSLVAAFTGYQIHFLSKEDAQAYPKMQEIKVLRGTIRKHSWKQLVGI